MVGSYLGSEEGHILKFKKKSPANDFPKKTPSTTTLLNSYETNTIERIINIIHFLTTRTEQFHTITIWFIWKSCWKKWSPLTSITRASSKLWTHVTLILDMRKNIITNHLIHTCFGHYISLMYLFVNFQCFWLNSFLLFFIILYYLKSSISYLNLIYNLSFQRYNGDYVLSLPLTGKYHINWKYHYKNCDRFCINKYKPPVSNSTLPRSTTYLTSNYYC